jgi:hypothetical protein
VDALSGSRAISSLGCRVGCGFVSALLVRRTSPLALMDYSPTRSSCFDFALIAHPFKRAIFGCRSTDGPSSPSPWPLGGSLQPAKSRLIRSCQCTLINASAVKQGPDDASSLVGEATVTIHVRRASNCFAQSDPLIPRAKATRTTAFQQSQPRRRPGQRMLERSVATWQSFSRKVCVDPVTKECVDPVTIAPVPPNALRTGE